MNVRVCVRIAAVAHIDHRQYFTVYCCHLHTQPCAHDRMHDVGETRAFIYLLFICQRARYRSAVPPAHDPAGDRFEKLLIVLFWIGVPRHSGPLPIARRAPFMRANQTTMAHIGRRASERAPFRSAREGSSRRCEAMGGDKPQKVEIKSTRSCSEERQIKT